MLWTVFGSANILFADNIIPLFEYYESSQTKVIPLDGKYPAGRKAEWITAVGNLLLPIYRNNSGGVLLSGSLINVARTEFQDGEEVPKGQQKFPFLNVMRGGLITYFKLNENYTPIVMVNYFNHPIISKKYRPVWDYYIGTALWKDYKILLRVVHHPNGRTYYSPLLGWEKILNAHWNLDLLLPAHAKIEYANDNRRFVWSNGFQGESREFPATIDGESGWITGYHVRVYSKISYALYKALYFTFTGGGIFTHNRFFSYTEKLPSLAFDEVFTPFLGGGLEARF
jgi:hypothetical protein